MPFETSSHTAHETWYDKRYPDEAKRAEILHDWKRQQAQRTINYWLHERMYQLTDAVAQPGTSWLTVGDGYGLDGYYLTQRGCQVTATDISATFLPLAQREGFITSYSVENAEKLSFADNQFDYVLCKESYHHFPRPYLALYEMIRVARAGVILIEPHDPISKMPFLLALRNLMDRKDTDLLQKYWKNRYSFEEVGNYVFKLSEREVEKLAMGMNLPAVAFKGINNSYYRPQTAFEKADRSSNAFRKVQSRLRRDNLLSKIGVLPYQLLCAVVFKRMPIESTRAELQKNEFIFYSLPENPYLKKQE